MELRFTKLDEAFRDIPFVDVLETLRPASMVKPLFQLLPYIRPPEAIIGFVQALPDGSQKLGLFKVSIVGCMRRDLAIVPSDTAISGPESDDRLYRAYALTLSLAYPAETSAPLDARRAKIMADIGMPGHSVWQRPPALAAFGAIIPTPALKEEQVASGLRPVLAGESFSRILKRVRQPGREMSDVMKLKELKGHVRLTYPMDNVDVETLLTLVTGDGALAEFKMQLAAWKSEEHDRARRDLPIGVDYAMYAMLCVAVADALSGREPSFVIKRPDEGPPGA